MKIFFFFTFLLLRFLVYPTSENKIINWRWGGEIQYSARPVNADIGFYLNDFPFSLNRKGEWGEIVNHNVFAATEIYIGKNIVMAPKIGYEFNYVFFQFRISALNYNDFKKSNNTVIRPEVGLTLFGLIGVDYGLNLSVLQMGERIFETHKLSIGYNLH